MNWSEYLVLSEKTLSSQFNCNEEKYQKLLHSVIGILTEVEELLDNFSKEIDPVNVMEECSDVLWYLAIIGREYGIIYPQLVFKTKNEDPEKLVLKIIKNTCKLLDSLKKKIYYNKPVDERSFKTYTTMIMVDLLDFMNIYDINPEKTFDINIEKLKARYGEKFSSEKAINRDLEKERDILEGN